MNEPKTRAELRRMEREWMQREAVIVRNAKPLKSKPPQGYEAYKKRKEDERKARQLKDPMWTG